VNACAFRGRGVRYGERVPGGLVENAAFHARRIERLPLLPLRSGFAMDGQ
jgi:hypothetical protein